MNEGVVTDCKVEARIHGGAIVGGFVGLNTGTVSNCNYSWEVVYKTRYSNADYIGGIVGLSKAGTISNCAYTGWITISVKDWESSEYAPHIGPIVGGK
ncbi:MAG: hypothetical protein IJX98_05805 [Clostridia bacterium]|nr:hypothetical protein [Clostridia bacterium]